MRKHTVTHDDNGWTHEEIVEDGNFKRDGMGIGANGNKVGVGYRKEWFSGTRMLHGTWPDLHYTDYRTTRYVRERRFSHTSSPYNGDKFKVDSPNFSNSPATSLS